MELQLIVMLLFITKVNSRRETNIMKEGCSYSNDSDITLGDIPISKYPWLGILYYTNPSRGGDGRTATTVGLIHPEFVVASASDIGPMQKQEFRRSRVLLGEGWGRQGRRVRSCAVHPEYGATHSTLALLQLMDPVHDNHIKPLLPPRPTLLSNPKYYVIKFHEDLNGLQKQIISVTHVPGKLCENIYVSSKMYANKTQPRHVVCVVTEDKDTCIWQAGAVLVSRDVKGRWQLIGVGTRGPGCGTPSRFLHMLSYLPWVRTSVNKFQKLVTSSIHTKNSAKTYKNLTTMDIEASGWETDNDSLNIKANREQCMVLKASVADIDTVQIYPTFDFQPRWARNKKFWNESFEERYKRMRNDTHRPSLQVIVVPHSHNDPGWLLTFEKYFELKTEKIIHNIVKKLHQYPNMTFIWNEISFLEAWWNRSELADRKAFKKLIEEERLEITTGGWVMPDEACTHIYGLLDQYIEGHEWIKRNLGILPKTGWSIDPFGHGPTVPYLLDKSGIEGAIIQRIHFAWKHWLAHQMIQEFLWIPGWSSEKPFLVVHNQPFDIYSIKNSCGPHTSVCVSYDFRYALAKHEEICDKNLHMKSQQLIEEYTRIGSLTTHNVVLVPLGDDFRYEYDSEFDAQYINYMKMFNYINSHKDLFGAEVKFGTPLDFFKAMKERHSNIPTFRGDFFVYADIYTEGKPAYWSGYYTTRPYFKIITRQFEHHLRTSEILFTYVSNYLTQNVEESQKLKELYVNLITARRNYGLFQHHDAITGTSRKKVMIDYCKKLFTSINHCIRLQEAALTAIMLPNENLHGQSVLQSESEWETYKKPVKKLQVSYVDKKKVVLFNPLAEDRTEVITLRSDTSNIRVYDNRQQKHVQYQITPNIDVRPDGKRVVSETSFDIMFVATLPALTAVSFNLEEHTNKSHYCEVFCNECFESNKPDSKKIFKFKRIMPGDIKLKNKHLILTINSTTGLLKNIFRREERQRNTVNINFGAYQSASRFSGAYLFKPDSECPDDYVQHQYANRHLGDKIVIMSGPVSTEIRTTYWPFLEHSVRIYNFEDPALSRGVFIQTNIDFGTPPKNGDMELFMRIQTDIQNGDIPEYYTDQNGFQYQKRVKVEKLGIEANYYPITTMAWLQDETTRLTLVTNHAQGSAAFEPGRLELMLDRRTLYDDFRGMGEGVVDNWPTVFHNWLLLEPMAGGRSKRDAEAGFGHVNQRLFGPEQRDTHYELPSQTADYLSRTLNYPVNTYLIDSSEAGEVEVRPQQTFVAHFPAGVHLVTLRTITDAALEQFPSPAAYLVLQRPGVSCSVGQVRPSESFSPKARFTGLAVSNLTAVSLTGLRTLRTLRGLHDVRLRPMELNTYRICF